MASKKVLIVGAGPTGMTAAIELKRMGMDVRVVDKCNHLAQHSQALVVQARTLEQFQRYGLADTAIAHGRRLREAKFYSEGKLIVDFKLDGVKSPYPFALFIPQSETESLLNGYMEALGVKTERNVELISLKQDPELRATLRRADGQTEEVSPRWLIGCDGAHSVVREKTGTVFEGARVGLSFFLADAEITGPDVPQDELSLHVSRGNVVFLARLTDKVVRLIVALHEQPKIDSDRELTVEDLQGMVDRVGVRIQIHSAEWMTPFHVTDRQAKHYRVGNVFLAGDASHIHSPVGGQGMNTGIQDVANLAWKLAAVVRGADDSLLDSYEEERGEVGKALLRFTERGLKLATISNPVIEKLRDTFAPIIVRLPAVQRGAVGFVSETAIEYRSSSIVADFGSDGHLRAGDRLPDLPLRNRIVRSRLLEDWTAPKHRVFGLNLDKDDIETMKNELRDADADVVSVATSDFYDDGRRLLGDDGKIFVLRPDGYVGFRSRMGFQAELMNYARRNAFA
ncbi:MAG TPA: FAD-dependent monooxygenase [Terracidiphilus sp.]|nr:FAD-dependent monooxygenase [Terracidiphilus sp.]